MVFLDPNQTFQYFIFRGAVEAKLPSQPTAAKKRTIHTSCTQREKCIATESIQKFDTVHFFSFTINASIVTNGVRLALNLRHY